MDDELHELSNNSLLHLSRIYFESGDFSKSSETASIVNAREACLASKLMQGLLIKNGTICSSLYLRKGGNITRTSKFIDELAEIYPDEKWAIWLSIK